MLLKRKNLSLIAAAALAAGAIVDGCGSSSDGDGHGSGATAGESGVAAAGSAGSGAAGGAPAGGTCGSAGTGAAGSIVGVPPDWELYPGYSYCPIYYPGAKGKLPDPVEWEPCPTPGPDNSSCRRMKTPWTKTGKNSLPAAVSFWFDKQTGKAYLQFGRNELNDDEQNRSWYRLVADADGPILNAFYEERAGGCALAGESLEGGKYAFEEAPLALPGPGQTEGVLAGDIGSSPSVVLSNPVDTSHTGWAVSSNWLIRVHQGKFWARHWGSSDEILVQSAALDPEGMSAHLRRAVGEAIFWEVGGLTYRGIMSWTEAAGARSLVRYPGDYTEGASNFGTDGVDMVWMHGQGKAPSDYFYPVADIMTAPFATDPDAVKASARRLRSDPYHVVTPEPYGVGCGYAARQFPVDVDAGTGASQDLLIVRLSDGVSWIVDAPPVSTGVMFIDALGFTCEEAFAEVQFPDDAISIVRIRLDSLGPGIAPD